MKIPIITGETCSGKSDIAYHLSKLVPHGELVNIDLRQIYRETPIGTNRDSFPIHLTNICDITENISPLQMKQLVEDSISKILLKGHTPIIVGGSLFYIDILTGRIKLDNKSISIDKYSSIPLNVIQSITKLYIPDIEINNSDWMNRQRLLKRLLTWKKSGIVYNKADDKYVLFGTFLDDNILKNRIDNRTETMLNNGLINEYIFLQNKYGERAVNFLKNTIGYKEIFKEFNNLHISNGSFNNKTVEVFIKLKKNISTNTYRYAKRQLTWMKKNKDIVMIKSDNDIINIALKIFQEIT